MAFKRSVFLFLLVVSSTFLGVEIARGQVYSLQTNVLEMRGFAICLLLPECVIGSVNLMGVLISLEFTE